MEEQLIAELKQLCMEMTSSIRSLSQENLEIVDNLGVLKSIDKVVQFIDDNSYRAVDFNQTGKII